MPEKMCKGVSTGTYGCLVFLSLSQKFGEIQELHDQDATSVVMTFKTRSEAENVRPADMTHSS